MNRPKPKKHALCLKCFEVKPLLMPVGIIPGFPVVVWELLCLQCRMTARCERARNHRHGFYADAYKFSPRKDQRDAYDEWLLVTGRE